MSRVVLLAGVNQRYVFTVGSVAELVFLDQETGEELSLPCSIEQAATVLEFCAGEDGEDSQSVYADPPQAGVSGQDDFGEEQNAGDDEPAEEPPQWSGSSLLAGGI